MLFCANSTINVLCYSLLRKSTKTLPGIGCIFWDMHALTFTDLQQVQARAQVCSSMDGGEETFGKHMVV